MFFCLLVPTQIQPGWNTVHIKGTQWVIEVGQNSKDAFLICRSLKAGADSLRFIASTLDNKDIELPLGNL